MSTHASWYDPSILSALATPRDPGRGHIGLEASGLSSKGASSSEHDTSDSNGLSLAGCLILLLVALFFGIQCPSDDSTLTTPLSDSLPSLDYVDRSPPLAGNPAIDRFITFQRDDDITVAPPSRFTFIVPTTTYEPSGGAQKTIVAIGTGVQLVEVDSLDKVPLGSKVLYGEVKVYVGRLAGHDHLAASAYIAKTASRYSWEYYNPEWASAVAPGLRDTTISSARGPPQTIYVYGDVAEVHGPTTEGFSFYDVTVHESNFRHERSEPFTLPFELRRPGIRTDVRPEPWRPPSPPRRSTPRPRSLPRPAPHP
jgi:hypothetical protein